ncbi:MAG TPA: tetraacyldisaccharide 4'-kinase [Alphaproteobacteria bacterium]|nr:tetraacyldisaccharide 4'-kinase [Alphaproteobacteria bacterium]
MIGRFLKAPAFWYDAEAKGAAILQNVLSPFGKVYGWASRQRFDLYYPVPMARPVICVGNLVTGGAGKTPVAMSLVDILQAAGHNPHLLSRGYGGSEEGPIQVSPDRDTAADVGDEALLLVTKAPTWVSRNRALGAQAAIDTGASVIIMDDGYQNPAIYKNFSLVVIDGGAGFGNGAVMPAGPLREDLAFGLSRAHAIAIIGEDTKNAAAVVAAHTDKPVYTGRLKPDADNPDLFGKRIFAFAGIGRPEKFRESLIESGAVVDTFGDFPDHCAYEEKDLGEFMQEADAKKAIVVTTAKDHVRLPPALKARVSVFNVHVVWDQPDELSAHITASLLIPGSTWR